MGSSSFWLFCEGFNEELKFAHWVFVVKFEGAGLGLKFNILSTIFTTTAVLTVANIWLFFVSFSHVL